MKKLIEVALPIKEISAESVRDKSIRHGHISTLHLWWARRPLPVCRAIVFASLVPDPQDEQCPKAFRDAIDILLGKESNPTDAYKPYLDIPWTAVFDPMTDSQRNRLQMFVGKFTDEMQEALLHHKSIPAAGKQLSDFSLIKWDNKNNEEILNKARKLIFVAHNATQDSEATDLLAKFDSLYANIKDCEQKLYSLTDRHLDTEQAHRFQQELQWAIDGFLDRMPKVFDPFAGGGAIPLEAARLGCRSYGNDINPVAHIIQKGSLEFPQKYGKPIVYTKEEFLRKYEINTENTHNDSKQLSTSPQISLLLESWEDAQEKKHLIGQHELISVKNRLAFDVAYYAKKLLNAAEKEIGHLYPDDENGKKPIAYYWARVGTCSNPACRAEVPLLKGFYLANTTNKQVYLNPIIKGTQIEFEVKHGKYDEKEIVGWNNRGNLKCPCCGSITDVKQIKEQSIKGEIKERLLAVIIEGENSKKYRIPTEEEITIVNHIPLAERPKEKMQRNSAGGDTFSWGITEWGQMFSLRQLYALQTLVGKFNEIKNLLKPDENEYAKAVITYLAILVDRIAIANTSFGRWHTTGEKLEHPFSKQAIPMMFDYPESNPFCHSTGSALNQLDWLTRYIISECNYPFEAVLNNASSGTKSQFPKKYLTAVVTDPPYYDAIAYADLSDFFYVWLKRTLGDVYPLNFATPQTPKGEECTALKHHHHDNKKEATQHFENKLLQIFEAIEHQTSDIVSIMFAHQTTDAWTTLCNSILGANMNITGSWAIDTEMANRSLGLAGAVLTSSVTVACRPSQPEGYGDYKEVRRAIEETVAREVSNLYSLGFRGADLLTACFGQAVSVFGKYQSVEKADGTEVTVGELLEIARTSALNALLKGFDGDDFTKFYIAWLQLYGFAESDFDDAAKFSRVGLSIDVSELFAEHILIKRGNKQVLASFAERMALNQRLGLQEGECLLNFVHRAMALYKGTDRTALVQHIGRVAQSAESSFWRVLTSLCELLPSGADEHTQADGLRTQRDNLIRESKQSPKASVEQSNLFA